MTPPLGKTAKLRHAAEAALWLLVAWGALRVLPFRVVARLLRPAVACPPARPDAARHVTWAVKAAARRVPWSAVCFPQGIAAQRMLCRRGVAADLHYGVAREEGGGLAAHVWVTAGDTVVVGGEVAGRFTRVATFSPVSRCRPRSGG